MSCFKPITAWQRNQMFLPNKPNYTRTSELKKIPIGKPYKDGILWLDKENNKGYQIWNQKKTERPVFILGKIKDETKNNLYEFYSEYVTHKRVVFKKPQEKSLHLFRELQIPCGKCIGCLLDKANDWATRCWAEMQNWTKGCFVTLTYDDEHLPDNKQLRKKDLQDFWKRLRYFEHGHDSWYNPKTKRDENPIRYLCCGEYGPNPKDRRKTPYGRPHYHALIFNWEPNDLKFYKENHNGDKLYTSEKLKKIWKNGFVIVGRATYESACYVSRYVSKKAFKKQRKDIEPEFIETSRNGGIGLIYWLENKEKIIENQGLFIKIKGKVKLKNIPKYFMRKFEQLDMFEFDKFKYKKQKQGIQNWTKILKNTSLNESEYKEQMHQTLLQKARILRRDNII